MSDKRFRPPSACKHGGFSKTVLFPWEDADEFDALHRSLQEEWEPSGALEEDAVYTILTCIWQKRRICEKRNIDTLAALQRNEMKVLSEMPLPFFDTKEENTMHALKHMPRSDGRPRYDGKVSHLIGFSSSIGSMSFDESIAYTENQTALLATVADVKEGLKAFGGERKPLWPGA